MPWTSSRNAHAASETTTPMIAANTRITRYCRLRISAPGSTGAPPAVISSSAMTRHLRSATARRASYGSDELPTRQAQHRNSPRRSARSEVPRPLPRRLALSPHMGVEVSRAQGWSRPRGRPWCGGVWGLACRGGAGCGSARRLVSLICETAVGLRTLVRRSVRCLKSSGATRAGWVTHRRKRGRSCVRECPDRRAASTRQT